MCTFDDYDCGYIVPTRSSQLKWEWESTGRVTTFLDTKPESDHTLGAHYGELSMGIQYWAFIKQPFLFGGNLQVKLMKFPFGAILMAKTLLFRSIQMAKVMNYPAWRYSNAKTNIINYLIIKYFAPGCMEPNYSRTGRIDASFVFTGGYWFAGADATNYLEKTVLKSPSYDAPKQTLNCLHFYYYMDADGSHWWYGSTKEAYLQAHINVQQNSSKWDFMHIFLLFFY